MVCGGGRLWPGIVASVRLLRQVSNLPVQLWYRGFGEPVDGADLAGVPNVTYHDGEPYLPRIAGGWEIKTAALLNCGLWRAVLLDADAYFVADPRPFLDLATSETPFVFWQDLHSQKNSVTWAAFGLSGSNGVPPIQGGHVAVDLLAWRRELVLSHWLSQHSDYFYQFGFGDQDMHRAALAATGGRYRNLGMVGWKWPIYTCSLDGKPVICHRCRAKCYEPNGRTRYPGFPGEDRYLTAIEGVQEPDAYAVDARHRDMIRDELMTGRYKRVLEIGCHDGYSTQAFIDALRVGKVEEVHLCDVAIRPKVRELVRGLAGVTVHERPSLGVLERERYDLVFVDGDHTGPNCEAEARLLLDAGTAAVFAHDSKGMSGDGPPKLAALFRAAGYRCWEDAEQRPGERTHRGLFFAARPGVSTTRLLERSEV